MAEEREKTRKKSELEKEECVNIISHKAVCGLESKEEIQWVDKGRWVCWWLRFPIYVCFLRLFQPCTSFLYYFYEGRRNDKFLLFQRLVFVSKSACHAEHRTDLGEDDKAVVEECE